MNNQSVLMSPELLPSTGWLAVASSADEVWLDFHETFPKQTLRNRFYILTSQGPAPVTIPVIKDSKTLSKDVLIDYSKPWSKQVIEALAAAYRKAPFFEEFESAITRLFSTEYASLFEMQQVWLSFCLDATRLQLTVRHTEGFRQLPHEVLDATELITKQNYFQNQHLTPYNQCFSNANWPESMVYQTINQASRSFVPGLSCIDLVFNTGAEAHLYLPHLTFA